MFDRILRAIRLDPTLYREVADNENLTGEAIIIAVATAIIGALGVLLVPSHPYGAYFLQLANDLILGWLLWSVVAYFVGNALGGRSSISEMIRTLGYASAPRFLGLFGFIPCLGWIATIIGAILSLVAGIIGIRESMEFDTTKALITAVVGFAIYIIVSLVIRFTIGAIAAPLL